MKSIEELNLKGKRVFIRADMNVPLDDTGAITDDHRILASLPTIKYVLDSGGSVVVSSHVGQPKGKRVDSLSLKPVATRLSELLKVNVRMAEDCIGDSVEQQADQLQPGEVLVLENPRFHAEETDNDSEFAGKLAKLADVYVNDAFASNHRAHATTEGIARCFTEKAAGFTLVKEMEFFERAMRDPKRPLAAIFGGAKVSTKMRAIKNVAVTADCIIVGGAMANTFFVAQGLEVGKSLYEPEQVEAAKEAISWAEENNCKLFLPTDVVVAEEFKGGIPNQVVAIDAIPATSMALDIGPESLSLFGSALKDAQTIVWNGPMGAFEIDEYSAGTYGIIDILAASSALTVVGGGDTDLALHRRHAMDKMGYVSTGGGAFLQLLEGRDLPGVEALG